MPYKSKAQHRLFRVLEAQGKLPKGTASEWAHHTPSMKKLPEHVKKHKTKQSSTPDLYQLVARQLSRGKKFKPEQLDLDKSLYEHGYDDLDLLDTTSRYADLAKNDQLFQEGDIDFGNLKLRELQEYLAQRQTKKAEEEAQTPPNYRQALGMVNTCGNCLNYEAGAGTCNKFKVPVSNDYVCDAYNQNKSMVSQIKLNTNFVSSKPKTDFSSGVEDVKPLEIKSGSSMNNPHAVPMVNPVRPIAGVGFGGSGQAPNNIGMNNQTSKQVGNTVPPGSIVQWLNSQAQQLMKARQPQQQPQQGQPPVQQPPQGQPQQQPPPGQAKQAGFFNLLGQTLDKQFAKEAAELLQPGGLSTKSVDTVGRVNAALEGTPYVISGRQAFENPRIDGRTAAHEKTINQLSQAVPEALANTGVRLGGPSFVDDVFWKKETNGQSLPWHKQIGGRMWQNPRSGPLGKLTGYLTYPFQYLYGATARRPYYSSLTDVVHNPTNSKTMTEQGLGRALDYNMLFNNSGSLAKTRLGRLGQGTLRDLYGLGTGSAYQEYEANRHSLEALRKVLNRDEFKERMVDRQKQLPAAMGAALAEINADSKNRNNHRVIGSLGGKAVGAGFDERMIENAMRDYDEYHKQQARVPVK